MGMGARGKGKTSAFEDGSSCKATASLPPVCKKAFSTLCGRQVFAVLFRIFGGWGLFQKPPQKLNSQESGQGEEAHTDDAYQKDEAEQERDIVAGVVAEYLHAGAS